MEVLRIRSLTFGRILVPLLIVAALAVIVTGCGSDDSSGELNGITRVPPARTGNLTLPDDSPQSGGREIEVKGQADGLMLVYFGYTSCPDVCPTTLADLRNALAELDPDQRQRVQVSMVTVDPDRDTGHVLNGYLAHFFGPGQYHSLRTTDPARLDRADRIFGASHKLGKPDADGNYDVSHTALVYAVDPQGTVEVEWPFGTDADLIAEDLKTLLDKNSQNPVA
ncbi:MAG: SCO family protein [Solirubrobacterales bacterium]|nr:SCO family protein [Solirubrobacterales bacterium]